MIATKQRGAASLFIVIFTALLVTVVTVGFTQVMIRNQQQSQAADLSQSAYDAALAGVEDAKRILVHYAKDCENTATPASDCTQIAAAMDAKNCTTTVDAGLATVKSGTEAEVQVNDPDLNQSYTCVKIERFSTSYPGILTAANPSVVIPISPHGASATTLRVFWFTSDDVAQGSGIDQTNFTGGNVSLPQKVSWSVNRPPIIRTQYIPADVANDSLDASAQTVFGYPKDAGGRGNTDTPRRSGGFRFRISSAKCDTNFSNSLGACHIDIPLTPAINDGQTAYVQLSSVYLGAQLHVNTQLLDAGDTVLPLNGIPTVDSTGRTAERFRRVEAKVKVGAGVSSDRPQPRAALDITGNICKTFFITDRLGDYSSGGCNPAN